MNSIMCKLIFLSSFFFTFIHIEKLYRYLFQFDNFDVNCGKKIQSFFLGIEKRAKYHSKIGENWDKREWRISRGYMLHPVLNRRKVKSNVISSYRKGDLRLGIRRGIISGARRGRKEVKIGIRVSLNWNGMEGGDVPRRGHGISVKLRSSLPRDEILIYISILVAFG